MYILLCIQVTFYEPRARMYLVFFLGNSWLQLLGIQSPRLQLRTCRSEQAGHSSTWPMPSWLYKADHSTRPIIALIEADDDTKPVTAHLMMH